MMTMARLEEADRRIGTNGLIAKLDLIRYIFVIKVLLQGSIFGINQIPPISNQNGSINTH